MTDTNSHHPDGKQTQTKKDQDRLKKPLASPASGTKDSEATMTPKPSATRRTAPAPAAPQEGSRTRRSTSSDDLEFNHQPQQQRLLQITSFNDKTPQGRTGVRSPNLWQESLVAREAENHHQQRQQQRQQHSRSRLVQQTTARNTSNKKNSALTSKTKQNESNSTSTSTSSGTGTGITAAYSSSSHKEETTGAPPPEASTNSITGTCIHRAAPKTSASNIITGDPTRTEQGRSSSHRRRQEELQLETEQEEEACCNKKELTTQHSSKKLAASQQIDDDSSQNSNKRVDRIKRSRALARKRRTRHQDLNETMKQQISKLTHANQELHMKNKDLIQELVDNGVDTWTIAQVCKARVNISRQEGYTSTMGNISVVLPQQPYSNTSDILGNINQQLFISMGTNRHGIFPDFGGGGASSALRQPSLRELPLSLAAMLSQQSQQAIPAPSRGETRASRTAVADSRYVRPPTRGSNNEPKRNVQD